MYNINSHSNTPYERPSEASLPLSPPPSILSTLPKDENISDEFDAFQLDSVIDDFVMTDELKYPFPQQNSSYLPTKDIKIQENNFELDFNIVSQPPVNPLDSYFEASDLDETEKEEKRKSTRQKEKLSKESQRTSRRDNRRDSHKEDKKETKKDSKKDRKDSRKDREDSRKDREFRRERRINRDLIQFDPNQGRDKDHVPSRSSIDVATHIQYREAVNDSKASSIVPHAHALLNAQNNIPKRTLDEEEKQSQDQNLSQNGVLNTRREKKSSEKATIHQTINSLFDSESDHSDTTDRIAPQGSIRSNFVPISRAPSSSSLPFQTLQERHQISSKSDELALLSSSLRTACESTHVSIVGETLSHLHEVQQAITRRIALYEKSAAVSFENYQASSQAETNLRFGTLTREMASINSRTQGIELRLGGLEVELSSFRAESFQYLRTLSLKDSVDKTPGKTTNMEKKNIAASSKSTQFGFEENNGWQFTLNSLRRSLDGLQDKTEENLRSFEQRLNATTKLMTTGLKSVDEQAVSLENRIKLSLKAREENSSSTTLHRFSTLSKEIEKRLVESTRFLQASTTVQGERIELAMETSAAAQSTSADALEHVLVLKNAIKEVNKTAERIDGEQTKAKTLLLNLQRNVETLQTQVSIKKAFDENDLKRSIRPLVKELISPMVGDMVRNCVQESVRMESQEMHQKTAARETSAEMQNKIQHMVQEEVKNVSLSTLKKDIFDGLKNEIHEMIQNELQVIVQQIMQNVRIVIQQSVATTVEAKMREWIEKNRTR